MLLYYRAFRILFCVYSIGNGFCSSIVSGVVIIVEFETWFVGVF